MGSLEDRIIKNSNKQSSITPIEARELIVDVSAYFKQEVEKAGLGDLVFVRRQITRISTKFRDAGRRSPPWRPASQIVPGRPQNGSDGNRQARWNFDPAHKFYASEVNATLVEVKYYLQTLSLEGAPAVSDNRIVGAFEWLLGHEISPGSYLDPIQLIQIKFNDFFSDARILQSGHLVPLDRGGKHLPSNAFLMLQRSNQLQGNLTLEELLNLMEGIVRKHKSNKIPELNTPNADQS